MREDAKRDSNRETTLLGVSDVDGTTPVLLYADPVKQSLYVTIAQDDVGIGGGTQYTEDAAAAANPVGNALILVREDARAGSLTTTDGDNVAARGNNKGELYVKATDSDALLTTIDADTSTLAATDFMLGTDFSSVFGSASLVSATPAVKVEEQGTVTVDLGVNNDVTVTGTVDLGATDNAVLDSIVSNTAFGTVVGGGTQATALRVTIASDSTGVLSVDDNGGAITVDGSLTSAGNVTNAGTFAVQVDGNALTALQLIDDTVYVDDADWTADTSKHNLVGGVTQATPTANTDGDTTPLITNALRELRVAALESDLAAAGTTHVHKYYTSATPTDGIIWSPAAGKRWYLTHLSINVSAASTVTIEDDKAGGDDPVYKAEFAANSGVVLTFPNIPLFSGEDAADLTVTASAGTVYVTAVGYEI